MKANTQLIKAIMVTALLVYATAAQAAGDPDAGREKASHKISKTSAVPRMASVTLMHRLKIVAKPMDIAAPAWVRRL